MTGEELQAARKKSKLTQAGAAREIGVTQAYLSMLERGLRPMSEEVWRRAAGLYVLKPTDIPFSNYFFAADPMPDDQLAGELAALGYPGLSPQTSARIKNPIEVLVSALNADERPDELVEALPWLVINYSDMNWRALFYAAKVNDLQNRLGYITNLARRVAEHKGNHEVASILQKRESELEPSRLHREQTLCNESMHPEEQNWLKTNRPQEACHWRLIADLSPEHLDYYE